MIPILFLPSCNDTHVHKLMQTGLAGGKCEDFKLPSHIVNVCSVRTAPVHDERNFLGRKSLSIRHNDITEPYLEGCSVRP